MNNRDYLPTLREWAGFAVWIVVICALVFGATKWRDHVIGRHVESPAVLPAVAFVAPTVLPARKPEPVRVVAMARLAPVAPRIEEPDYPFHTLEPDRTNGAGMGVYRRRGFYGVECTIPYVERGAILSENQIHYRAASSGCGPTAILDWLIWYQNFGLVPRSTQHSDLETYKRITFDLIDRKIAELRGRYRSDFDGPNTSEIIVVFDELISELSQGRIRLDCEITNAPLSLHDLLNQTRNYRAGILIVQVFDPLAPPYGGNHAVAVVRTDTEGRTSIATWGQYQHGRLITKPDGQWFACEDGSRPTMKVQSLLTFIPFRPTGS